MVNPGAITPNNLFTNTRYRQLFLILILSNIVTIVIYFIIPTLIVKATNADNTTDFLYRMGFIIAAFMVMLFVFIYFKHSDLHKLERKPGYITLMVTMVLGVVAVQLLIPILRIDLSFNTYSRNMPNLSRVTHVTFATKCDPRLVCTDSSNPRPQTTITDPQIVQQLVAFAKANQDGWLDSLEYASNTYTFELEYHSGNNSIYTLGIGNGVLTGDSFAFKGISIAETERISKLVGR